MRTHRLPKNGRGTEYADLYADFAVRYRDFRPLSFPLVPLGFGGSRAPWQPEVPVFKGSPPLNGDPAWIRTRDLQLRRLLLYPPELRGRRGNVLSAQ